MSYLNQAPSNDLPVNIYIHIPYCNSFCFFCPYYKVRYSSLSDDDIKPLIEAIKTELKMYSETEFFKKNKVTSLYFGGGDGAIIDVKYLQELLDTVVKNFTITEDFVVSLEGHVWSLSNEEKLDWFKSIDGKHLSFGVQTFNENIRKKVFLKPSEEEIYNLSDLLHNKGLDCFSFDMIYNFPDQTLEDIDVDIEKSIKMDAEYIDIHNLNVYPNTKFEQVINEGKYFSTKPTNEMEVLMYEKYIEGYEKKGYKHLGSIYFSKKREKPFKTFINQSRSNPVLGIGPSARTYIERRSYRDCCSVKEYIKRISEYKFPIEAGNIATQEEDMERVMVFFPQLGYIEKEYIPQDKKILDKIEILHKNGYVEWENDVLKLTHRGKIYCGNVASYFFSEKQKEYNLKTVVKSMIDKTNPYNQDNMGTGK
ncbi:MAG: radical SAM protein [Eubacterium sp.]|nr:radical SAM protein [Eubacterium sp.]